MVIFNNLPNLFDNNSQFVNSYQAYVRKIWQCSYRFFFKKAEVHFHIWGKFEDFWKQLSNNAMEIIL